MLGLSKKTDKNDPDFKLKQRLKKTGIELINYIIVKFGLYFLITCLPILLVIFLFIVIIAVIIYFIPHSEASTTLQYFFVNDLQVSMVGGFIDSIINAMFAVLYLIFIKPIIWINGSLQTIIVFVGTGALSNRLFDGSKSTLFWLLLGVSSVLLIVTLSMKAIEWMQNRNMASVKTTTKNALMVLVAIMLIPTVFIMINLIMVEVASIFISNINEQTNLSLLIFNSSFTDGVHHFNYIPDSVTFSDSGNFSYFICLLAEGFLAFILILITIQLFFQVFELFVLYCLSPIVLYSAITDEGRKFQNWKEATLLRAMAFSLLFLAFNIFLMGLPIIGDVSTAVPNSIAQPVFVLVGTLALGLTVVKFPQLISTILGGRTSLSDGIGNLFGVGLGFGAVSNGTKFGFGALGKSVKFGWNSGKKVSQTAGIISAINRGKTLGLVPKTKFGVGLGVSNLISNFSSAKKDGYTKTANMISNLAKPEFGKPDFNNLESHDYANFVLKEKHKAFIKGEKEMPISEVDNMWATEIEKFYYQQKRIKKFKDRYKK